MIFILAGLSGAGKGTLAEVFKEFDIPKAISYTTREPRPKEEDGVDYYFIKDESKFKEMPAHDFHRDVWYGISRSELEKAKNVWCEMSLKGVQDLKEFYGECQMVTIWVDTPLETCSERLIKRDGLAKAKHRIKTNKKEQYHWRYFDRIIPNRDKKLSYAQAYLSDIIKEEGE